MMTTITIAELLQDKARQMATSALFSVAPDTTIAEAISVMVTQRISSILVIENENMQGLITLRELLQGFNTHGSALLKFKCRDAMKVNPPVAKPDDSVDHLRGLMTEMYLSHVPVMDHDKLVGILSFHDIARSAIKDADFENRLLKQYIKNWPE